ncbi:hypothetical protein NQ318_002146 [Aromia moschata]|uniref:N(6)-adenosine-methyltransferase non-catalytic subunit METTL14 n=1 Tax=Aromia moschata TaxID=1265417 RepID=A0AAV8XZ80_9CUCU|nr:hypothetical protein NQ318_002146 [Aromia moschata]
MGDMLKELREKSRKRKLLLAQTLGVSGAEELRQVLGTAEGSVKRLDNKESGSTQEHDKYDYKKDTPDELVYRDSSMFLKGTQSSNPHNDYCQHFVDTGQRPQNFIRDVGLADRFEEYPKLRELIKLKDELIQQTATPPMYLKCDLATYDLKTINCKFDVILIEPPLEEYQRTMGGYEHAVLVVGPDHEPGRGGGGGAAQLRVPVVRQLGGAGHGSGLPEEVGVQKVIFTELCEDICWIRTNIKNPGHSKNLDPRAVFQRTKEHCLMGIKGTVRRSTDGDFIHANVDIDLIISEENEYGSLEKPVEIFHIIEHFCLGRRRLHVFGRDSTIRPGWLTIGPELTNSNFNADLYASYFSNNTTTTGCTERIEALRPKSPPPKGKGNTGGRGRSNFARGRGRAR